MPELTLHFEASPGTDLGAAAAELKKNLGAIDGVESASTKPQRFQAVGPAEVISVIKVATTIAQNSAEFLTALAALYAAWQKVKPMFPGLHAPTLEVGLKKIPIDQVNADHRADSLSN
jgi:hypothetical protein